MNQTKRTDTTWETVISRAKTAELNAVQKGILLVNLRPEQQKLREMIRSKIVKRCYCSFRHLMRNEKNR